MVVDGASVVRKEDTSPAQSEANKVRKDPEQVDEQIRGVAVYSLCLLYLDGALTDRQE